MPTDQELQAKALDLRKRMLLAIYHAGAGHTGGSLSCLDVLILLYNRILKVSPESMDDPNRDRYIQSKGHSVEALYTVLADRGFFPWEKLDTLCHYQSHFVGHPTRKVPGIEQNTGALGHGLPIAVGTAIGARLGKQDFRVFTLMGDGELAEGSNWEAAMSAAHYQLDNLTALIDCNTLQITGRTRHVMSNDPLPEKFAAFGWDVESVNGHDFAAMTEVLNRPSSGNRPKAVILETTKGRGVSFMEDVAKWHHGVPSEEQLHQAIHELDAATAKLEGGIPA